MKKQCEHILRTVRSAEVRMALSVSSLCIPVAEIVLPNMSCVFMQAAVVLPCSKCVLKHGFNIRIERLIS